MAEGEATAGLGSGNRRGNHVVEGRLLALAAAAVLGGTTPFARLAYDAGTSPKTLLAVRFAVAVLIFVLLLRATSRPLWPARADVPAFLAAGLALTGITVGYLLSIAYIPVGLAALLLYTYPLMVAAVAPFIDGTRLGGLQWLAFLAAFCGLAAALGPDVAELDPRGVMLALAAAVSQAALLFLVRHLTLRHDPVTILLSGNLIGLIFVVGLLMLVEPPRLSMEAVGLAMLAVAAGLYVAGIGISFLAVRAAGPTETALFLNLEPVMAILLAMLLLGESLSFLQAGGVLLVLAAIYMAGRRTRAE